MERDAPPIPAVTAGLNRELTRLIASRYADIRIRGLAGSPAFRTTS